MTVAAVRRHWIKILAAVVILVISAVMLSTAGGEQSTDLFVQPRQGTFQITVTATGELEAKNSVKIYGPATARQLRIYQMQIQRLVPEGTLVQKGDFVAELDRTELASRMADAQIELDRASSQFEQTRLDTLLELSKARDEQVNLRFAMEEAKLQWEGAAYEAPSVRRQSEINFDKADRTYEQSIENYRTLIAQSKAKMREVAATLSKARKDVEDLTSLSREFTITAPEVGMVVYRRSWNGQKLTEGGTLQAWDPVVAELPDLSLMESVTYVNEVDIQKIRVGQDVLIGLDADPDKKLTGSVQDVANIGEQRPNSDAKVFLVTILVNEADTTLRPAMTTSNEIVVADVPGATFIPLESIHVTDSLNFVFMQSTGGIVRQEVQLGMFNDNAAIVEGGVSLGDEIYLSMPADTANVPLRRLETASAGLASTE